MSKDPEEVLPENRLTTVGRIKEVSTKLTVEHQLNQRHRDGRECEDDQEGSD